jgi:hypothetical protein
MIVILPLFSGCEEKSDFGTTQVGFLSDTVYQTATDGILRVSFDAEFITPETMVTIFIGDTPETSIKLAEVIAPIFTEYIKLRENTYWKVIASDQYIDVVIYWTPIIYN